MKIKFVDGILPALVVYTKRVPKGSAGCANGPVIRILPSHKNDEGLLQHELIHVQQAYRLLFIFHALLYYFNDSYRLQAEVEAYRKQLEYSPDKTYSANLFARFICEDYNLQADRTDVIKQLEA
jgi:hypothetical protein